MPPISKQSNNAMIDISEDGKTVKVHASDKTFGSSNKGFVDGLMKQIINIGSQGAKPDAEGSIFVASVIAGIKPRDELEGMLAAQMAAVHNATMTFSRRLAHVDNIRQQDSAERALNKLARTYALQMQALQKYRSGGKQSVVVKHVHVNESGQAIVGNVQGGGGLK